MTSGKGSVVARAAYLLLLLRTYTTDEERLETLSEEHRSLLFVEDMWFGILAYMDTRLH